MSLDIDYYELLEVERNADDKTLKSAYRKLAMQYHPDKNPGCSDSEARFKAINEAYDCLKDPQKRAAYDRFGKAAFQNGGPGGFGAGGPDLGDIGDPRAPIQTTSTDTDVLYGLLDLYHATKQPHFLRIAAKIGDNLIARQSASGLFPRPAPPPRRPGTAGSHAAIPGVVQPARVYARTGDEIPLALLHLGAAIAGKSDAMPRPMRDEQYFHCPFHGPLQPFQKKRDDTRTYDWLVFYGVDGAW